MAWTTPRTWATSEVVTAAMLNTHLRDNLNWLHGHHGCLLFKSANQTVASGNNDVISWNSESYDTDALHDPVTNNSRITIPTGLDGYWALWWKITTDADAANHNVNVIRLRKNAAGVNSGGTLLSVNNMTMHTNANAQVGLYVGSFVATDHLELFDTASGEARDITGSDATLSNFGAVLLGT